MEDSTSIFSLPNKAATGNTPQPPPVGASQETDAVDPQYMNQIINGIQQSGGATLGQLPSRNIPMNTMEIQQDPATRPNYIPQAPPTRDYITEYENRRQIAAEYIDGYGAAAPKKNANTPPAKSIYDDLYLPILVAILFFIFNMPTLSAVLYKYARFLHTEDGNLGVAGVVLKSAVFGTIVYAINIFINSY
jgi:hypothetical protein